MAQRGQGLLGKKDVANTANTTVTRKAEKLNSVMAGMEELSSQEVNGNKAQKKETLSTQVETTMKQNPKKERPKRKRTVQNPVLAAVLKHHKDDDDGMDPPAKGDAVAAA